MTDETEFAPISTEGVKWETFDRGRFGSRFRHLTRAVVGEDNPNESCVYPDSNKASNRWLGERYDRAARMDCWDKED
jgi:hypothetical protein